jgi:ParB-like chromosome segregation protein Spo0J
MPTTTIPFHPLANLFPLMEGEEFDALVADIKANGLHYPIVLYDGKILDGRNRYRACLAAGFEPAVRNGDNWIGDPASFVISRNIRRRHLTAEQKRDLIARLLKAAPEKSDRQIAETVKASPTFVGKVRAQKETSGDVSTVDTRTDKRGRKQPAKKSTEKPGAKQPARKPVRPDPRIIAPELADRVGRFAHDLILSERLLARELADIIMLPGVCERLSADLTNGLALAGNDADPETSADDPERTL